MSKTRTELTDVIIDGQISPHPVVIQAVIYGDPGVDIWVGDKCISLGVNHCKKLIEFLNFQYTGISDIFTLFDDDSVREKLKVMNKWDAMMDDSRNSSYFGDEAEVYLKEGKKYRVSITEVE